MEKDHVWKELGAKTQGRGEVEVETLPINDKNNAIAENVLSYF